jgi:CBS domain-containing protein
MRTIPVTDEQGILQGEIDMVDIERAISGDKKKP